MEKARQENYGASRTAKNARPLGELLPLDTPLSLMIDPSNVCNLKCVFCPTGNVDLLKQAHRPKGLLAFELFDKIVADLEGFPDALSVLHLYKDGEPLVNKSLGDMIRRAKQSDRVRRVETTTNGLLLTPERSRDLIEAGLDGIRVSVYALSDSGYLQATRTPARFEKIRRNVEALYSRKAVLRPDLHVHCKIVDAGLSDKEKRQFIEWFSPISDSVHIDSIMGWSNARGKDLTLGLAPERGMLGDLRDRDRRACSEPFMKLAINHDGTVSVCCVDWAHETVVGDVNVESLPQIWRGERLKAFRLAHLRGLRSSIDACSSCDYVRGLPRQSNFDHLLDQLLPIFSKEWPNPLDE